MHSYRPHLKPICRMALIVIKNREAFIITKLGIILQIRHPLLLQIGTDLLQIRAVIKNWGNYYKSRHNNK